MSQNATEIVQTITASKMMSLLYKISCNSHLSLQTASLSIFSFTKGILWLQTYSNKLLTYSKNVPM